MPEYRFGEDGERVKWSSIVREVFRGRRGLTSQTLFQRYNRVLHPKLKRAPWSKEEDRKLMRLCAEYGRRWSKIARDFDGTRCDVWCRQRWERLQKEGHTTAGQHDTDSTAEDTRARQSRGAGVGTNSTDLDGDAKHECRSLREGAGEEDTKRGKKRRTRRMLKSVSAETECSAPTKGIGHRDRLRAQHPRQQDTEDDLLCSTGSDQETEDEGEDDEADELRTAESCIRRSVQKNKRRRSGHHNPYTRSAHPPQYPKAHTFFNRAGFSSDSLDVAQLSYTQLLPQLQIQLQMQQQQLMQLQQQQLQQLQLQQQQQQHGIQRQSMFHHPVQQQQVPFASIQLHQTSAFTPPPPPPNSVLTNRILQQPQLQPVVRQRNASLQLQQLLYRPSGRHSLAHLTRSTPLHGKQHLPFDQFRSLHQHSQDPFVASAHPRSAWPDMAPTQVPRPFVLEKGDRKSSIRQPPPPPPSSNLGKR